MTVKPHSATAGETQSSKGLTLLGHPAALRFDSPDGSLLEAFPNRYPGRDYVVCFEYPEFTSLCPVTGQPDFGLIRLRYAPNLNCVESKSFKLYMGAFRNHGSFMESITNKIADDLITLLQPRRIAVEGLFNTRGGTSISVCVEHMDQTLEMQRQQALLRLW